MTPNSSPKRDWRKERTAPTPAAHREWVDKTNAKFAAIDPAAWMEEETESERFEFSKIWLGFHFLPDFSKNRDLVEDIIGRC